MTLSEKDQKAACALLARRRRANRKKMSRLRRKCITNRLSKEEGRQLSVSTKIDYDPKNDHATITTCLKYCHCSIYPGTNRHLSCYDQTGRDLLMKERERHIVYYQNPEHREEKREYDRTRYQKNKR